MAVWVDPAGKNEAAFRIDLAPGPWEPTADRLDPPLTNADVAVPDIGRGSALGVSDHKVEVSGHRWFPNRREVAPNNPEGGLRAVTSVPALFRRSLTRGPPRHLNRGSCRG